MALEQSTSKEMMEFVKQFSFSIEFERPQTRMIRYRRDGIRIDVWESGTLGIYKNGKQSFFKNLTDRKMKEIISEL